VLTFLPAGDCLTTNSLLQLTNLKVKVILRLAVYRQSVRLGDKTLDLLSNGCRIFAYLAVVAQQRVNMPQYKESTIVKPLHFIYFGFI
jgi:hypothetical protein